MTGVTEQGCCSHVSRSGGREGGRGALPWRRRVTGRSSPLFLLLLLTCDCPPPPPPPPSYSPYLYRTHCTHSRSNFCLSCLFSHSNLILPVSISLYFRGSSCHIQPSLTLICDFPVFIYLFNFFSTLIQALGIKCHTHLLCMRMDEFTRAFWKRKQSKCVFCTLNLDRTTRSFFKKKMYFVFWDVHMNFCQHLTFSQQVTAKNQNIIVCIFQLKTGVILYLISDHPDVSKKVQG